MVRDHAERSGAQAFPAPVADPRLRGADALQLSAAIVWAGGWAEGEFVSFDERLREAARLKGFSVV